MMTLRQFSAEPSTIPTIASWYIADLSKAQGWHEGKHDPWPYINYLLSILKLAYREFEDRVAQLKSPRGAKTEQVEAAVKAFTGTFTLYELEHTCMGVSRDMVRKVLRNLQKAGLVECLGRGPGAIWRKKG